MSIVVGLDPSLVSTGIAILTNGQPTRITTIGHRTRDGQSYAHRSDRIVTQCRAVIDALECNIPCGISTTDVALPNRSRIDLAIIEGPAYGANLPSAHDRAGLFWGLYSSLRAKKIPTVVVPPATVKKWATGVGNATKPLMLDAARQSWPNYRIPDHNAADAIALASIGAAHCGDPLPFELRDRHHNTLESIDWPKVVTV